MFYDIFWYLESQVVVPCLNHGGTAMRSSVVCAKCDESNVQIDRKGAYQEFTNFYLLGVAIRLKKFSYST